MFMSSRRERGEAGERSRKSLLDCLTKRSGWISARELLDEANGFSEDLQDLVREGLVESTDPAFRLRSISQVRLRLSPKA